MVRYQNEDNDSFFREFVKNLEDGDQVLHIGFARRDLDERRRTFERDKSLILAQTTKDITVIAATTTDLAKQLEASRAVFVTGGDTEGLIEDVRACGNFAALLSGKVVAGSSAGAYLLSRFYFSGKTKGVLPGLGILPVRILCHYGNPEFDATDEALDLLRTYSEDAELLALKECAWVVRTREL